MFNSHSMTIKTVSHFFSFFFFFLTRKAYNWVLAHSFKELVHIGQCRKTRRKKLAFMVLEQKLITLHSDFSGRRKRGKSNWGGGG